MGTEVDTILDCNSTVEYTLGSVIPMVDKVINLKRNPARNIDN